MLTLENIADGEQVQQRCVLIIGHSVDTSTASVDTFH